jgi:hypothetical protein
MLFAGKWMELEIIMLREVNLAQKDKNHMLSLICGSLTCKMINVYIYTNMAIYICLY